MALSEISPFCYQEYVRRTQRFASWTASFVQNSSIYGRAGWVAQFRSYTYSRPGGSSGTPPWQEGVLKRAEFHKKLVRTLAGGNGVMIGTVNEIMKWGGLEPYPLSFAGDIREALHVLQHETKSSPWTPEDLANLDAGGTIASLSKVYEMFDPHKWTIYDSRVATALACLVRHFWTGNNKEVDSDILCFPVPRRHKVGWRPPQGFPTVRGGHQGSKAFVYASWLLRQVAEILRNNPKYGAPPTMGQPRAYSPLDANWQVYHVEMALWMLGDKEF
jgi:hypothetical protein